MADNKQKYLNPITCEAEIFVQNLQHLAKTHKIVDPVLVASLEKVMNAIDNFLDSCTNTIVETHTTQLVKCINVTDIKRIYHCEHCKTDLGKKIENVAMHLMEPCSRNGCPVSVRRNSESISIKEREQKQIPSEIHRSKCKKRQEQRQKNGVKLSKKTCALLTDFKQFLENQIKIGIKLKCLPEYDQITKDLMKAIQPHCKNEKIKIYQFGSRLAGTGTRQSDLDLYLDIGDTFHQYQYRPNNKTLLHLNAIEIGLKQNKNIWPCVAKVAQARVPILKVLHGPTGIECDINFSNSLGTINTKLLEYIFDIQPIAHCLCIFMKKWLLLTKLSNEMSTYSFTLMVLFYLQNVNLIPSVEQFQENINEENVSAVGPWNYKYNNGLTLKELGIQEKEIDKHNLLKLIMGFFNFYKNFSFDKNIICPYLGKIIQKSNVKNSMPPRYTRYLLGAPDCALQVNKAVVVQDPLELNHNTTKGMSASSLDVLKILISKSIEVLKSTYFNS